MKTSEKPSLCDVSFLVPLLAEFHAHHDAAWDWFKTIGAGRAVICRVAQLGLLRVSNNPSAMQSGVQTSRSCWQSWHELRKDDRVQIMVSEPIGLDDVFEAYTVGRNYTRQLWTDAYLAAFAKCAGFQLVTFDQGFKQFSGLECHILKAN